MFRFKVIDNFLNDQDFTELSSVKLDNIDNKSIKIFHNRIFKNGIVESSCLNEQTIRRLHQNYHNKVLDLLKEFSPKKIKLYEYSDFHIVIAGKDYSFPIHTDTLNKLLSGVVYLKPLNNLGTRLYEKNKVEYIDIEWKQNRSLFFSRGNETFHSYKSDGNLSRMTLIYNLMTTDIKSVCNVERKSYFLYKLKNYFKKLILK